MSQLLNFIEEIKSNQKLYEFDEANTKQALILRLLSLLGWEIFNVEEVAPEYGITGLRVDYSLRIFNQNKVFIEAKKVSESLDNHQEQLLNYSFKEGVKLAILTNGVTWWFYLPLNEGNWEQRRFYSIDILQQDSDSIIEKFNDFLNIENVKSSFSLTQAEKLYKGRLKNKIIKENIPKAWEKVINEPDELLVELINDTVEKLCGIRANNIDIINFINTINMKKINNEVSAKSEIKQHRQKITNKYQIQSNSKLPPNETICKFVYKRKEYYGVIKNNLLFVNSVEYKSFSAASNAISNTSRNGWNDWKIKLSTNSEWMKADAWRKKQKTQNDN